MATVLALPLLVEGVTADLEAVYAARTPAQTAPTHVFGWREPQRHGATHIVWVPGNDGELGAIGPARNPGRNPRPLATIEELFTIYVHGFDATDPENELAQYTSARLLFDDVLASIYRVAHGTIAFGRATWVTAQNVRRHGATIRLVCSVQAMVPDEADGVAPTDTDAVVTSYGSDDPDDDEGETDTVSAD